MELFEQALAKFNLTVHPLANAFPIYSKKKLQSLSKDIKDHGLKVPILLKDNVLIDGRNRLMCCFVNGITPEFKEVGADEDISKLILSYNRERRELSKSQWAAVACEFNPDGDTNAPAAEAIAKQFSISRTMYFGALKIKKKYTKYFEDIKLGKKTVSQTEKMIAREFGPLIATGYLPKCTCSIEECNHDDGKIDTNIFIEIPIKLDDLNKERIQDTIDRTLKKFKVLFKQPPKSNGILLSNLENI